MKPQPDNNSSTASETPPHGVVKAFFLAVEAGDAESAQESLEMYPVLAGWRESATQATALIVAARKGHADIAEILLGAGADLKAEDAGSMNAIRMAAHSGHGDVCDLLISKGADAAEKGWDGASAIDRARAADFYALSERLKRLMDEQAVEWRKKWHEQAEMMDKGLPEPLQVMKRLSLKPKL
jgi:hypothetical protein